MFALRESSTRSILFANGGGCAHRCLQERTGVKWLPPSMLAMNKSSMMSSPCVDHVCLRYGSFCLQLGGGSAPPPTTPLFKGHRWLQRKRTSVRIHAGAKGRLCGSFCLQLGGAAPPPTPRLFKGHRGCKKEQASGFVFALKKGCADGFVCNWGGCAPPNPPAF